MAPAIKQSVALKVPVAGLPFGARQGEKRRDFLGSVFLRSEFCKCEERQVVWVARGAAGSRKVGDRIAHGLTFPFQVLIAGVAMLQVERKRLDHVGREVVEVTAARAFFHPATLRNGLLD